MADRYEVELKPKIPTSRLDSQLLFPARHHWLSGLVICILVYLANSPLPSTPNPPWLKSSPGHLHPVPSCCTSTTPYVPSTAAQRPSAQVRSSTRHGELPESRNSSYSLPHPQCSTQCLRPSSTQGIILTKYLKAKYSSLQNPKSMFSPLPFAGSC